SLDPLLRQSEAGRAIFVTSGLGRMPIAYWGPYATSKAGLEMLVRTYAAEVSKTKLRVNLIDPGIVRTALRAKAFPGENPMSLKPPEATTDRFVDLAEVTCTLNGERVQV